MSDQDTLLAQLEAGSTLFPFERPPVDPPAEYGILRREGPITRAVTRSGEVVWLVSRYDDVRQILADPRASADMMRPGFPLLGAPALPEQHRPFLRMDPPRHSIFRRHLARHFLVRQISALRPRIEQLVADRVDDMLRSPSRTCDLVNVLALPVPSTVLSWLLGVPEEDQGFFNEESERTLAFGDPNLPDAYERSLGAQFALFGYLEQLMERRKRQVDPGSDILGSLVTAAAAGEISFQDVVNTCFVLIIAGHDTTASMTALGVLTLLQHPDQMAELTADPDLVPGAVEELLRYLTVVHLIITRVAAEDIEIGGVTIPAGEGIIPLNLSANRDDAHFPDPDTFDLHRNARDHFAFGYGIHQCIGQHLARIELEVIISTLLKRVPGLALDVAVEDLPFKLWSPINGLSSLPVSW